MLKLTSTTENLTDAAAELRYSAQSLSDLKQWFKENAHLLCELPETWLPLVNVTVEIHNDSLTELIEKKGLWLTVIFNVPKKEEDKNPLEQAFSLVRGEKKSLYNRFYHMPLSFSKWPICTAMLAHAYYSEGITSDYCKVYAERAHTKLNKFLPMYFPNLTVEKLDSFSQAGLLPKDKVEFIRFMFESRNNVKDLELPATMNTFANTF